MSWEDISLKDVSATVEPVPPGQYTFQLLAGTKKGDNDPDRIELSASIAEGPQAGRRMYFNYPSPSKCDWSPRILKRLIIALGVEPEENEHPVAFLNRAVMELGGNARFAAPVKLGKSTEAYPTPKHELDIFNVRPAA